jgi:hypothetical protein
MTNGSHSRQIRGIINNDLKAANPGESGDPQRRIVWIKAKE